MSADLRAQAYALRSLIGDITTLTARDLVGLYDEYGDDWGQVLPVMWPQTVRPYAALAAQVTTHWYDQLLPESSYRARAFVDLPDERFSKSLDWALNAPGEATPLDRLCGSSQRMVADASRQTVVGNAFIEKVRWQRVASPDACNWCQALTNFGRTDYLSEDTAVASHDNCRCTAVPVRSVSAWKP